jgi:hypothetical protein
VRYSSFAFLGISILAAAYASVVPVPFVGFLHATAVAATGLAGLFHQLALKGPPHA